METINKFDDNIDNKANRINKIIAIFPGRFQPFGPHHYKIFKWLSSKFGLRNTYITTSNKVEFPRSPLSFNDKLKVIMQYGIPRENVIMTKNPYTPKELLSKFDSNTTAAIFVYGKKDAGRLSFTNKDGSDAYFKKYENKFNLLGYEQAGYVIIIPHITMPIQSYGEISGTVLRKFIPKSNAEEFKSVFGWYDSDIHNYLKQKFSAKKINEISNGSDYVDDGPRFLYGDLESYQGSMKNREKLPPEFKIIDWIIDDSKIEDHKTDWPNGPVPTVTFFPAGSTEKGQMGTKYMKDMIGTPAYNTWLNYIKNVIGMNDTLIDTLGASDAKSQRKPIEETIKKVGSKWVVYPKKGGNRLGTHDTKEDALKQLAAIEINKESINERVEEELDIDVPANVLAIHRAFIKAGKKLYIVGGAVRDAIIGKTPKDFDLATDAKPDEVLRIARNNGLSTSEVGKEFGVVVVDGEEIATFREDVGKGRRPDSVNYTDIEGDVKRRDLTMNALFYDIETGKIVDLVGGIADLRNNRVRTVGKASDRFEEDPLRKLRALRFQTRFGAEMDDDIYNALKSDPSLKGISANRIRDELIKSIQSAQSTKQYFETMDDVGMTQYVFPNLSVVGPYIDENDYEVQLAYILRNNQPKQLPKALNKLTYTNDEKNNISFLVSMMNFKPNDVMILKKFQNKTTLSDTQIINFGKHIGKDFNKFVNFDLSVSAADAPSDVKGKAMGDWIKNRETELYLNESINEGEALEKMGIKDFKSLFKTMPADLQKRVYALKTIGQRPDKHPEGNVLKHTITVVNRSLKDDDIDIAIAAMMHDIGKDETAAIHPKKGYITHYGHEKVSAKLVKKYIDWIKEIGGNPANIYYIIKNHMRYKQLSDMRPAKQQKMKAFRAFDKLTKFGKHDRGGLDIDESVLNGGLLNEGGVFGHMMHPYECEKMKFSDIKKMISDILSGDFEGDFYEKIDGQNMHITYRDGEVLLARNKQTLQNPMTVDGVKDKYKDKPHIQNAFVNAMNDISDVFSKLDESYLAEIFKDNSFMNIEVVNPESRNVIDYGDDSYLVLLSLNSYDNSGNLINTDYKIPYDLHSNIMDIGSNDMQSYTIIPQNKINVNGVGNYGKKVGIYHRYIDKMLSECGMSDNNTIGEYIDKNVNEFDGSIRDKRRNAIKPLELMFIKIGSDVLNNVDNNLSAKKMDKNQLIDNIKSILMKAKSNPADLVRIKNNINKFNKYSGVSVFNNIEGLVFNYNGYLCKLTGGFAPLNQILGFYRYKR